MAESARCKCRAEICQVASQEQGQPSAGHVCPISPSAVRGEEVGGLSMPRAELIPRPQFPLCIPDRGRGDPGRTLGGAWFSPLTRGFKSMGPSWKVLEDVKHVVCSPIFQTILRPIYNGHRRTGTCKSHVRAHSYYCHYCYYYYYYC